MPGINWRRNFNTAPSGQCGDHIPRSGVCTKRGGGHPLQRLQAKVERRHEGRPQPTILACHQKKSQHVTWQAHRGCAIVRRHWGNCSARRGHSRRAATGQWHQRLLSKCHGKAAQARGSVVIAASLQACHNVGLHELLDEQVFDGNVFRLLPAAMSCGCECSRSSCRAGAQV